MRMRDLYVKARLHVIRSSLDFALENFWINSISRIPCRSRIFADGPKIEENVDKTSTVAFFLAALFSVLLLSTLLKPHLSRVSARKIWESVAKRWKTFTWVFTARLTNIMRARARVHAQGDAQFFLLSPSFTRSLLSGNKFASFLYLSLLLRHFYSLLPLFLPLDREKDALILSSINQRFHLLFQYTFYALLSLLSLFLTPFFASNV